MRRKEKIYCDRCGKFLFNLSLEELREIDKDRFRGTRRNCEYYCKNNCKEDNKKQMEIEIFWNDLKLEVQESIAKDKKTTPNELCKEGNFDIVPIAIINI